MHALCSHACNSRITHVEALRPQARLVRLDQLLAMRRLRAVRQGALVALLLQRELAVTVDMGLR
jgi:hypothetical protein